MLGFLLQGPPGRLCMGLTCVLSLWNTVSSLKGEIKREKGMTFLPATESGSKEVKKEKDGVFLGATELPARSVDLSALNLTELVNGMLSRALKAESKQFFSLLSITSYSSFAFHKLSVAIYNISNLKVVDSAKFPARHCYCLNNQTNDLSDFTALLVDIIGNSTSYLTEIFKSTSILSVSQTNESDCIFICVMTGKSGRNLSDFWELAEKSPVINYTFTSSMTGVLGTATRGTAGASKPTTKSQQTRPSTGRPHWSWSTPRTSAASPPHWMETTASGGEAPGTRGTASQTLPSTAASSVARTLRKTTNRPTWASTISVPWDQTTPEKKLRGPPWETHASTPVSAAGVQEAAHPGGPVTPPAGMAASSSPASGTFTPGTQTPNPTKAPAPRDPQQIGDLAVEWPFTPREEPALVPAPHPASRCPQPLVKEVTMTVAPVILVIQKLNPCLMELCRFFQRCLCTNRRNSRKDSMRYCLGYYSWFLKNATFICPRVKTVSHSHTLKQKCLENICKSV